MIKHLPLRATLALFLFLLALSTGKWQSKFLMHDNEVVLAKWTPMKKPLDQ